MPFVHPDGIFQPGETHEEFDIRRSWAVNAEHYASWVWNEEAVSYLPPINPPDKTSHMWDEATTAWVPYSG